MRGGFLFIFWTKRDSPNPKILLSPLYSLVRRVYSTSCRVTRKKSLLTRKKIFLQLPEKYVFDFFENRYTRDMCRVTRKKRFINFTGDQKKNWTNLDSYQKNVSLIFFGREKLYTCDTCTVTRKIKIKRNKVFGRLPQAATNTQPGRETCSS